MRTRRIRGEGALKRRTPVPEGAKLGRSAIRLAAGLWIAIGGGAAMGAAWLIWHAPHCRPVPAHAYYTPMERCVR